MSSIVAEKELYRACQIIFGLEASISREFLEYLQPSGIKSAYRKKALETHPDRVIHCDELTRKKSEDLFRTIQQAYENLNSYIKARERGFCFSARINNNSSNNDLRKKEWRFSSKQKYDGHFSKAGAGGTDYKETKSGNNSSGRNGQKIIKPQPTEKLYHGPIPSCRLLFGRFLYYSGVIRWRTIIDALVWQTSKRPRLGEIGCRFGWLSEDDTLMILKNRNREHPFGRSAVELGLLTEDQLNAILLQQKFTQKKIGTFFVQNGMLSPDSLNEQIINHRKHNSRFPRQESRGGFFNP